MKQILAIVLPYFLFACSTDNTYDAMGSFEAVEVTIFSEASGKIDFLDLEEGQQVTKNQVVGGIDSLHLHFYKKQLEHNLTSVSLKRSNVETQSASLKCQLEHQKKEKQRVKNLYDNGAATEKQLDDINTQVEILYKQYNALVSSLHSANQSIDAQCESIQAQIKQAQDKLSRCIIKAPINGVVLKKYINEKELATQGRPLFKIANLEVVYLRAYIPSVLLHQVKLGQTVKVFADFGKGKTREYQGRIEWIAERQEFTPKNILTDTERGNVVYAIRVSIKNDGYIKLGMTGGILLK